MLSQCKARAAGLKVTSKSVAVLEHVPIAIVHTSGRMACIVSIMPTMAYGDPPAMQAPVTTCYQLSMLPRLTPA